MKNFVGCFLTGTAAGFLKLLTNNFKICNVIADLTPYLW